MGSIERFLRDIDLTDKKSIGVYSTVLMSVYDKFITENENNEKIFDL